MIGINHKGLGCGYEQEINPIRESGAQQFLRLRGSGCCKTPILRKGSREGVLCHKFFQMGWIKHDFIQNNASIGDAGFSRKNGRHEQIHILQWGFKSLLKLSGVPMKTL